MTTHNHNHDQTPGGSVARDAQDQRVDLAGTPAVLAAAAEQLEDSQRRAVNPTLAARAVLDTAQRAAQDLCGCCGGAGAHRCGHECDTCDATGAGPDGPSCRVPHGADCRCGVVRLDGERVAASVRAQLRDAAKPAEHATAAAAPADGTPAGERQYDDAQSAASAAQDNLAPAATAPTGPRLSLDDTDPELVQRLTTAGQLFGPLGVAVAAAALTDRGLLLRDLGAVDQAEVDRLRRELRDARNDLLAIRGILSPNGGKRRVPDHVEMTPRAAPAVQHVVDDLDQLDTWLDDHLAANRRAGEPPVDAATRILGALLRDRNRDVHLADARSRRIGELEEERDQLHTRVAELGRERDRYRDSLPAETQDYWYWRHRAETAEQALHDARQALGDYAAGDGDMPVRDRQVVAAALHWVATYVGGSALAVLAEQVAESASATADRRGGRRG